MRLLALALLVGTLLAALPCRGAARELQVQWLGHSAFLITSPGGTRILIDPFPADVGYPVRKVPADAVLVTSNLFDHKNVAMAEGSPRVLFGLTREGEWTRLKAEVGDVQVRALASYQDDQQGAVRGKNSMFWLQAGGIRLLHAGNLGHPLEARALAEVGKIDVFMVPVGGIYTLDGHKAAAVVEALAPRIAVPMHFRTPALRFQLQGPDKFLGHFPDYAKAPNLALTPETLPPPTRVYLLDYLH